MFSKRSVETPAFDHDNNIHEYDMHHECQGMFDIALFLEALSKVAQ